MNKPSYTHTSFKMRWMMTSRYLERVKQQHGVGQVLLRTLSPEVRRLLSPARPNATPPLYHDGLERLWSSYQHSPTKRITTERSFMTSV